MAVDYGAMAYGTPDMRRSPRYQRSMYGDSGFDDYSSAAAEDPRVARFRSRAGAAPQNFQSLGPYSGYNTSNAFIGPQGFSANQGVGASIADFYRQGAFDPSGGGAYLDAIKADLAERERADVAQAGLTSDIYGGDDPLARLYGRLSAEQGARNRYGSTIAQARAEAAARREQAIYALLQQRLGAVDYLRQPKTDYGAIIAGTAGQALGGLVG